MANNAQTREELNIPTIGSKHEYNKYKTYLSWKSAMSFAYRNNEDDIGRSHEIINTATKTLQNKIPNYIANKNNIFENRKRPH